MTKIEQLQGRMAEALGSDYELLEAQMQSAPGQPVLLVRVDRMDEQPVTVDDLEQVTRQLSALLDDEANDPVKGRYRLEVESPGAKRPLKRARHFERMQGLKAKVRGQDAQGRTLSFTAPIEEVSGGNVHFAASGTEEAKTVPLEAVEKGLVTVNLAEFPDRHR